MHENAKLFKKLLGRGAQKKIAKELNLSAAAVCQALDVLNPTNKVVQVAVKMLKGSDSVDTERQLTTIFTGIATPAPVSSTL